MKKLLLCLLPLLVVGCKEPNFDAAWTKEQAPDRFSVEFETTKGNFTIEVTRDLSPKAVDRFYQLVQHDYFDNGIFYRVVPDFVAQFGNTNSGVMEQWRTVKIPDEPVKLKNQKGAVSFARFGPDTRDLELFINLKNNLVLDTVNFEGVRGFPAIGQVREGMDVVEKLYGGYGEQTMSDENLYTDRAAFYQKYPKLDLIKSAHVIEAKR